METKENKCEICGQTLKTLKSYLNHVRNHSLPELSQYWKQCDICGQFFPTEFDRQSHGLSVHTEIVKSIKCLFCASEFSTNLTFFNHAHSQHLAEIQNQWVNCEKCDKFRPSKISLNVHFKNCLVLERKLSQIICKFCPLIFTSPEEYQEHLDSSHQALKKVEILTKNELECEFCIHEQIFVDKKSFLEHVKLVHSYEVRANKWKLCQICQLFYPEKWENNHDCPDKNSCLVCFEKFETQEQVLDHMDQNHPDHKCFQFYCDICNVSRPDKTLLMLHKLSHLQNSQNGPKIKIITSKKPLENANFATKVNVNTSELNEFICSLCNKKLKGTIHNHFQVRNRYFNDQSYTFRVVISQKMNRKLPKFRNSFS